MKASTIEKQIKATKDRIEILKLQIAKKRMKMKTSKTKLRILMEKLWQAENKN